MLSSITIFSRDICDLSRWVNKYLFLMNVSLVSSCDIRFIFVSSRTEWKASKKKKKKKLWNNITEQKIDAGITSIFLFFSSLLPLVSVLFKCLFFSGISFQSLAYSIHNSAILCCHRRSFSLRYSRLHFFRLDWMPITRSQHILMLFFFDFCAINNILHFFSRI